MPASSDPRAIELVFSTPGHEALLPAWCTADSTPALGACQLARHPNGELHLRLDSHPAGRACAALGSLAPPDEQLLGLLLLADTLRRQGARRVVALCPYLGYARQDRPHPARSLGAAWVGALLAAAGVEQVVTIDIHSQLAVELLPMPVLSLSPAPLFATALQRAGLAEATIVAPDEGALERSRAVAEAAGAPPAVTYLRKRRDERGITHRQLVGEVTGRVAIVDDILDTGETLLSACRLLREAGAREIVVLVTHALFTGERWRELFDLGVQRIYATDSVPAAAPPPEGVELLPVGQLLLDGLAAASV